MFTYYFKRVAFILLFSCIVCQLKWCGPIVSTGRRRELSKCRHSKNRRFQDFFMIPILKRRAYHFMKFSSVFWASTRLIYYLILQVALYFTIESTDGVLFHWKNVCFILPNKILSKFQKFMLATHYCQIKSICQQSIWMA